jgi:organic radical activating enzyme
MRIILEILLTNSCNRNCSYCVAKSKDSESSVQQKAVNDFGDHKLGSGILNLARLRQWLLLNKLNEENCQLVVSGGEPTLVRELPIFINWLEDNNFKPPIVYTNGRNIGDFAMLNNPKSVKVILTKHLEKEFLVHSNSYSDFSGCVEFLENAQIPFLLKVLTDGRDVEAEPVRHSVVEGIRKSYSGDFEEKIKQLAEYGFPLSGESPYRWRWNGYGDKIDRRRTKWEPTVVYTVDPTGLIYNCHIFDRNLGSIYSDDCLKSKPCQLAWCYYPDTADLSSDMDLDSVEAETRCEIQHYVNLMREVE